MTHKVLFTCPRTVCSMSGQSTLMCVYFFVRDIVAKGQVRIEKISTLDNPVDMLRRAIPLSKFKQAFKLA